MSILGICERPWVSAFVGPGDRIWIGGGTYKGCFVSVLSGSGAAPIVLRQRLGERAILDVITCPTVAPTSSPSAATTRWYWGLEIPTRLRCDRLAKVPFLRRAQQRIGTLRRAGYKIINSIVHDAGRNKFLVTDSDSEVLRQHPFTMVVGK